MILCRIDYYGFCELDVELGKKRRLPDNYTPEDEYVFMGLYYEDINTFFALYKTHNGPMMYFEEKAYLLTSKLSITVDRRGDNRHFSIKEYGIEIDYPTSVFIGVDEYSTEEEIDLFVNIANNFRSEEFYEKYTLTE